MKNLKNTCLNGGHKNEIMIQQPESLAVQIYKTLVQFLQMHLKYFQLGHRVLEGPITHLAQLKKKTQKAKIQVTF